MASHTGLENEIEGPARHLSEKEITLIYGLFSNFISPDSELSFGTETAVVWAQSVQFSPSAYHSTAAYLWVGWKNLCSNLNYIFTDFIRSFYRLTSASPRTMGPTRTTLGVPSRKSHLTWTENFLTCPFLHAFTLERFHFEPPSPPVQTYREGHWAESLGRQERSLEEGAGECLRSGDYVQPQEQ